MLVPEIMTKKNLDVKSLKWPCKNLKCIKLTLFMLQIVIAGNGMTDMALGVESNDTRTGLFLQLFIICKIKRGGL